MKQKFVCFALVLMLIINCSACGKTTYDFDKMADNLHADNGQMVGGILLRMNNQNLKEYFMKMVMIIRY